MLLFLNIIHFLDTKRKAKKMKTNDIKHSWLAINILLAMRNYDDELTMIVGGTLSIYAI